MIGHIERERTRGFPSAAVIGASVVLIAALSTVLVSASLDHGFFERTESFRGPFDKESSENSRSLIVALGTNGRLSNVLIASGDTPDEPFRSNLRLWINGQPTGPAHTIHEDIRKQGGGRYSHWGDRLLFSLPDGAPNGPETTAVVTYSPRIQRSLYGYSCLALALSTSFLAFRAWRFNPASVRHTRVLVARSGSALCLAFFGAAALATAIYLATILIGLVRGYALPNTAVFRLLPWTRQLALFEPAAHYVIVALAMTGAALSWLARSAVKEDEAALIRRWNRYGLIVIAALFLFSFGATWSGIARPEDLQSNALGGLVPLNDAHGYFEMTFDQVITGHWGPLGEQRPFAAAHRSLLMFLAGYSNVRFVLLQALVIACVTYTATRAVMLWRGLWSGLMFLGLIVALVRPYLITHLTEPLGHFWVLLSVPFVIRFLRGGSLVDGIVSFLALAMALLIRMGSMFTIPAFSIWLVWTAFREGKSLKPTLLAITAVLLGCALVSATLLRLYGSGTGVVGSNFSFVICGATHGGDWTTCQSLYRDELQKTGPTFGATQAHFLYAKAWERFRRDPSILYHRLIDGERAFLGNLMPVMLGGYTTPFLPDWFPRTAWAALAACGLLITFWRQRERRELAFWLLMWLGLLMSAPLVIFADGWRALSSILPFVALFLACGFSSQPGDLDSLAPTAGRASKTALAGMFATVSLWLVIPGFVHWFDPIGARPFRTVPPEPGQRVVLGSRHMAGFVVVPDDSMIPTSVPSLRRSDFMQAFESSHHGAYQKIALPPPSTSFAFIVAPNANGTFGTLFAAPAEVFIQRDVRAWRLTLEEEIQEEEDVAFARVSAATPVAPAPR